ncbi:MAG TPA: GNAT family N-acetyltransferase [Microlunatus sp.]|nr:GNAT family N-acetyltransferase [Microlunatus sp.]
MFPDAVPVLDDAEAGVVLRAHSEADLPAIIEQCRDPATIRWTTVPTPEGGYGADEARAFVDGIRREWDAGQSWHWAVELLPMAGHPGQSFGGSISVSDHGSGIGEVAFGLHPAARGRRAMAAALRLVRDHGFDTLGFRVLRWRAVVGNWGSRWTAAAAGFRFDGTVRSLLNHRDELLDGWLATITADDPRADLSWSSPPRLSGPRVVLRPFTESDLDRVVEACCDPETQHWLASLPRPYAIEHARAYLEDLREQTAQRTGLTWCLTSDGDRCLGSVSLTGFGGYARRLEIGYWAHPAARGQGLVAEAVRVITDHVHDEDLAESVIIRCAAGNAASRQVASAAGYRQNGIQPASEPLGDGSLDDLISYTRP